MNDFLTQISSIMDIVSYLIGLAGVLVIVIGVIQTIWLYITQHKNVYFGKLRLILNTHMILGLDFFIGKDVIDTFLMHSDDMSWSELGRDLIALITVITIRIVLSYFLEKEIDNIQHKQKEAVLTQEIK
jgi:uncharacterized membrane protein